MVSGLLRAQTVYVIGPAARMLCTPCRGLFRSFAWSPAAYLKTPDHLILDTEEAATQDSLDRAKARFTQSGSDVYRLRTSDFGLADLAPAASLIYALYPTIKNAAVALVFNPDAPDTLAKVTVTV